MGVINYIVETSTSVQGHAGHLSGPLLHTAPATYRGADYGPSAPVASRGLLIVNAAAPVLPLTSLDGIASGTWQAQPEVPKAISPIGPANDHAQQQDLHDNFRATTYLLLLLIMLAVSNVDFLKTCESDTTVCYVSSTSFASPQNCTGCQCSRTRSLSPAVELTR